MEWKKVTHKGRRSSAAPKKLTELYEDYRQDGARLPQQQHGGQDGHSSQYGDSPGANPFLTPLQQRNRFASLATPHPRNKPKGTSPGSDEEYEEEDRGQKDRERSPVKPAMSQQQRQEFRESQVGQCPQLPIVYPPMPVQQQPIPDPFEDFAATDEPITQNFFKKFMMSFSCVIQSGVTEMRSGVIDMRKDMRQLTGQMSQYVAETDQRVSLLEKKVADITTAYNAMVDAHQEVLDELKWHREKIVDSEDRNRRNNVKIRGIPESVKSEALMDYVRDVIRTAVPDASDMELTVDRVHRLNKPSFIADHLPRDVILRIHYFHIKERFLGFTRNGRKLPDPYKQLALYNDLSQATLKARREYADITTTLRKEGIDYAWNYPTSLRIIYNGTTTIARNVSAGHELLRKWGIPITPARNNNRPDTSRRQPKPTPMDTTKPQSEEQKSAEASGSNDV